MDGLAIFLLALLVIFYFLPCIICNVRTTQHGAAIFLINLFLGWTVLGWIAALIWAIVEKPAEPAPIPEGDGTLSIWEKKQKAKEEARLARQPGFPPARE